MLNNVGDLITEVLVRNNRTTTDSFITDAMLQDWTREANSWATSFHKWPFTEKRDFTTTWSGTEEIAYTSLGTGYRTDSIRMLLIGGKRLKKLNYEDYLTFREEESSSTDRVFSDYGRTLFINPNADVSGSFVPYGQYTPTFDPTDLTTTTIFSDYDQEGNEAYVEKMTSYLKRREHLAEEAELHDKRAEAKLDEIWKRILDESYKYQTHSASGGMWEHFDVLEGRGDTDWFKENQFN